MLAHRHIKWGLVFEVLDEGVLMALLDPRYTQVAFNPIFVQVCDCPYGLEIVARQK